MHALLRVFSVLLAAKERWLHRYQSFLFSFLLRWLHWYQSFFFFFRLLFWKIWIIYSFQHTYPRSRSNDHLSSNTLKSSLNLTHNLHPNQTNSYINSLTNTKTSFNQFFKTSPSLSQRFQTDVLSRQQQRNKASRKEGKQTQRWLCWVTHAHNVTHACSWLALELLELCLDWTLFRLKTDFCRFL